MNAIPAFSSASPLPLPDVVIFDMDGTTVRHVNPAFLGVLEWLDNILYALGNVWWRRGSSKNLKDYSQIPAQPTGLLVHRALHKIRRKDVSQIVQPCPNIVELLQFLKMNGIKLALASNGLGKGYGHDILDRFELAQYFDAEIFREDVQKSKPHPDGIIRALRAVKPDFVATDVVWHIGDRAKDIIAALAADNLTECKVHPFSYGLPAAMEILKNNIGVDHIIMNYAEFLERIKPLFSERKIPQRNVSNSGA